MILRGYQSEAVAAVWNYLRSHNAGNPLVVLPTGSGKSLVIAELIRQTIEWQGRAIVIAHRKELLEQNADKIRRLLPDIPIGIYSAGLNSRDVKHDVVVGGIQSIYERAGEFGDRKICIVDEAHLIPNKSFGMYREFLDDLHHYCDWVKVVGLTATPFRLQDGPLCDGDVFEEIVYSAPIGQLIEDGYLSNITNKPQELQVNLSNVKIRQGEYVQADLEEAFTSNDMVARACDRIVLETANRTSVIVFCSGVKHAFLIAQHLEREGEDDVAVVVGSTPPLERAMTLERFKNRRLKYLVNVDVLTTGFDAPNVDCVCLLRATMSAGLAAQMIGRGLRRCEGKQDCLVLDFGGNISRHGPIDDPNYGMSPRSSGSGEGGERGPIESGRSIEPRHEDAPDTESNILGAKLHQFDIEAATYSRHPGKNGKPDTFRATYHTNAGWPKHISEWICIEHTGWARNKAEKWWLDHCQEPCPSTIDEALRMADANMLRFPAGLQCTKDGKYYSISARKFDRDRPNPSQWKSLPEPGSDEELDAFGDVFEEFDDSEIPF